MKVLVINCGSSSLKYQLIDMEGEKVLCKGLCERIGMESSMITHEANGHKATTPAIFPTHTEAFTEVVKKMTTGEGKVIDSVSEIDAIGHRVVHGGEKFKESCLITPEVVKAIHDLSPLAPLHNPAAILGIEASYKVFGQDKPNVAVFDTAFHSTMPPKAYMYARCSTATVSRGTLPLRPRRKTSWACVKKSIRSRLAATTATVSLCATATLPIRPPTARTSCPRF